MSIELRKNRRIAGTVIIGLLFLFLVFALVKTQLIDADQYKAAADSLAVSSSSVKASRGEILDCNGKPLVTNRQGNSVVFKYSDFPSSKKQNERNDLIFSLINLFDKNDIEWRDPLPLQYKKGKLIIDKEKETEFEYMVSENMLEMEKGKKSTAEECLDALIERYGIEKVSKWQCQCFNEPDIVLFFLSAIGLFKFIISYLHNKHSYTSL